MGLTLAADAAKDHLRLERHERRRRVGGAHRDAAIGVEDGVLAIDRRRRIGITDVAAGAIAVPSAAVVPAARVLRHIAADGALVADLRRRDQLRGFGQQTEPLAHQRMAMDLGERRHRADLKAAVRVLDVTAYVRPRGPAVRRLEDQPGLRQGGVADSRRWTALQPDVDDVVFHSDQRRVATVRSYARIDVVLKHRFHLGDQRIGGVERIGHLHLARFGCLDYKPWLQWVIPKIDGGAIDQRQTLSIDPYR